MRFQVKVYSESGGMGSIEVEAPGQREAEETTRNRGYVIVQVTPPPATTRWRLRAFPLLHFSQQLHGLLRAGLSLVEAIETLAEKEPGPEVRAVFDALAQRLRHGQSLSAALAADPTSFPGFYVASLRASEQSGDVAASLQRFIVYQKQVEGLRKQVVAALIYPAVLLLIGGLVTLFLLGYVVPRFSRIYDTHAANLPLASQLMMAWGTLLSRHIGLVGIGLLTSLAGAFWFFTRAGFRRALADLAWRSPWLGERLRTYHLARLFRTVSMLLHGGTPLATALDMVPGLLHPALRSALARAVQRIREGESVSLAFENAGLTTPVAYRMLRVGERSGEMAEMLNNIAVFYDEEIERDIGVFSRIFEPVMMALIGILIGSIVLILYMPIFDLAGSLQ